jgi:hypothetical protein
LSHDARHVGVQEIPLLPIGTLVLLQRHQNKEFETRDKGKGRYQTDSNVTRDDNRAVSIMMGKPEQAQVSKVESRGG